MVRLFFPGFWFGGGFEVFDFAAVGEFGDGGHAVEEEDAVEVVVFVLHDAGGVVFEVFGEGLAVFVEGFDAEGGEAGDLDADVGEGEAAFFAFLFAFFVGEDGVDVGDGIFAFGGGGGDVDAEGEADLGGGEADAFVFDHEIFHAFDDGTEPVVEMLDVLGDFFERGVGVNDEVEGGGVGAGGGGSGGGGFAFHRGIIGVRWRSVTRWRLQNWGRNLGAIFCMDGFASPARGCVRWGRKGDGPALTLRVPARVRGVSFWE